VLDSRALNASYDKTINSKAEKTREILRRSID